MVNTDIKDDLKNACKCVVTNMSLTAIDGILNMTQDLHIKDMWAVVTSRKINLVEKPFKPGRKTKNA